MSKRPQALTTDGRADARILILSDLSLNVIWEVSADEACSLGSDKSPHLQLQRVVGCLDALHRDEGRRVWRVKARVSAQLELGELSQWLSSPSPRMYSRARWSHESAQ